MRNSKNIRTCKGCFKKYDKENHDMLVIYYDKENAKYYVFENMKDRKRAYGKGLYICKNEECIKRALEKNKIEGFFNKRLDNKTREKLEDIIISLTDS